MSYDTGKGDEMHQSFDSNLESHNPIVETQQDKTAEDYARDLHKFFNGYINQPNGVYNGTDNLSELARKFTPKLDENSGPNEDYESAQVNFFLGLRNSLKGTGILWGDSQELHGTAMAISHAMKDYYESDNAKLLINKMKKAIGLKK